VGSHADWEAAGLEATAFAEKELKSALEVRFCQTFRDVNASGCSRRIATGFA
jgi:hypothetical protein